MGAGTAHDDGLASAAPPRHTARAPEPVSLPIVRLTVETGPSAGTTVTLERDRQFLLGSGPDCQLRILEPGVAAQHAVVKALKDQGYGVKALQPGLRVNGRPTEAAALHDGDLLELGTTRISFGALAPKTDVPKISGFKVLGELGRGGMGVVYRAEQVSLHREVALKVLSHRFTRDPQFVARFVAEARAAAKLQHPNVVHVLDVDHDGDTYYYAMEVMDEGSLEDWLKKHGKMPVERALQVIADAAAGLAYAESLGIVHRDIKPDNLMLDRHGTVKIADLGLARGPEEEDDSHAGTPHFMAPEQVRRKPLDHRSDLYSLGCTFYRLVTGTTPFRGQTVKDILRAHLNEVPEPAHKVEPGVPVEVSAIIQKLMEKDAPDRYQSANELIEAVDALLQPPAKKGLWIGLAAAAVAVATGAIYWAVNKPKEQTIIERLRDNPEALRFATENEALKAEQREDKATIAFLRVQVRGLEGKELAAALERVASDHAGTGAARAASDLAAQVRSEASQREAMQQARLERQQHALAAIAADVDQALARDDWAAALGRLDRGAPEEFRGEPAFASGLDALRQKVLQAAATRLTAVRAAVDDARRTGDVAALHRGAEALQAIVDEQTGWPAAVLPDRPAVIALLAEARGALEGLQLSRSASLWQRYHDRVLGPSGLFARIEATDFAAAATAAQELGRALGAEPPGAAAEQLAAALQLADGFAAQLATAVQKGTLQLQVGDGPAQNVVRWQRAEGLLVVVDPGRRPPKESTLPAAQLAPEQWLQLADQVGAAEPGARECFLVFALLRAHVTAGRDYLRSIVPADDASGTGQHGYRLSSLAVDQLLKRLPETSTEPWCLCARSELRAMLLLATGLRALSERRSLGAAAHLEKLLGEHPHALVVAALP
jgi:serine/threonine-protein kinase